jgi:hypothetical protein
MPTAGPDGHQSRCLYHTVASHVKNLASKRQEVFKGSPASILPILQPGLRLRIINNLLISLKNFVVRPELVEGLLQSFLKSNQESLWDVIYR